MLVGAYWGQRKESKEVVAGRLANFLFALASVSEDLSIWYRKGANRGFSLRAPITHELRSLQDAIEVNRRDFDRQRIADLGFRFNAWNGSKGSLSATLGCWNQHVRNAVVLDLRNWETTDARCRTILTQMVHYFEPEHAVVASEAELIKAKAQNPWEVGELVYQQGTGIRERSI